MLHTSKRMDAAWKRIRYADDGPRKTDSAETQQRPQGHVVERNVQHIGGR